jgi:hypothetical protein
MTTMATTTISITSSITHRVTMTLGTGGEEAEAVDSKLSGAAPQTHTPTSIPPDGEQDMGPWAADHARINDLRHSALSMA